jgi:class 3 adenylate cyclase
MVSIGGQVGTERSQTVAKVAALISASESDVEQLVEEGSLERAVLTALRGRGVKLTPSVKNSVQATVRSLKPGAAMPEASQSPEPPSGSGATATIMFTDIVGSTGIMERLGDREGRKLMSLHDEIVRHELVAHDGVEVKALGDGFMLTFRSVARGLACAVAIQRDIALYNSRNTGAQIAVRIGLSVGEPIQDSEDLFGMSVIMAARISASAKGGQIIASQIAYALASSSGDFQFKSLGSAELKGVPGRIELYEVQWDMG